MEPTLDSRSPVGRIEVVIEDGDSSPISFGIQPIAGDAWSRLRDRLSTGSPFAVSFDMPDLDTEGHSVDTDEIVVDLTLGDDVEGHAVRLHFPTKDEAAAFRRAVLAAGHLGGSMSSDASFSRVALRPDAPINMTRSIHRG